jgi:hypothetical protein
LVDATLGLRALYVPLALGSARARRTNLALRAIGVERARRERGGALGRGLELTVGVHLGGVGASRGAAHLLEQAVSVAATSVTALRVDAANLVAGASAARAAGLLVG